MIEDKLREVIHHHLSRLANFDPYKKFAGVRDKEGFIRFISEDPAFAPFFFSNPKYATARVGGNTITSLHRKLGDLYEGLFQTLLAERFSIAEADLCHSVILNIEGRDQERSTDGLVRYDLLSEEDRNRVLPLARMQSAGLAFEVRSCYQIGDSKRIQADLDMALALKRETLEPVMLVFCASSLIAPIRRLAQYWSLYEGRDTFEFIRSLTDFDLYSFLLQEGATIQTYMDELFQKL